MTRPVPLAAVREALATIGRVADENPGLLPPMTTHFRRFLAKTATAITEDDMTREIKEHQTTLRLSESLVTRLDGYADRMREEQPGPAWSRSDVVRLLLARALDDAETAKKRK